MPRLHRRNLVLTVSASTARDLESLGVPRQRIRMLTNGAAPAGPPVARSDEPLFLALGRLAEYKRIDLLLRLWDRVRPVTGGRLVVVGDGPQRGYLESIAGPGVSFTGRVSEEDKHRLLSAAWLLLHPAQIEGWGIVITEAALRGTPAVGFDVPGLRDSVEHGRTGVLARSEAEFASAWAALALDPARRAALGEAARRRAARLRWSTAVRHFSAVIDEAADEAAHEAAMKPAEPAGSGQLRAFYEEPGVTLSSGSERAGRQARMLAAVLAGRTGAQRIVDVGCGDGSATRLVAGLDARNTVIGVDWSATALARARARGLLVIQGGVDTAGLPLPDSCADVVIMSELIEHLVDTDAAVDEARRVLCPGGVLLLSTPNLAAWFNRGLIGLGIQPVFSEVSLRGIYGRPGHEVVGHLRLFTRRALVEFLTDRGFECELVRGAPYHDVPRLLRPLDRSLCRWPSMASILLVQARRR